MKLIIMQFPPISCHIILTYFNYSHVTTSLRGPNLVLSTRFLNDLNVCHPLVYDVSIFLTVCSITVYLHGPGTFFYMKRKGGGRTSQAWG
jgi:hypothetical protein